MKKLGIIGGTSWGSTALYYDHINRGVAQRLGGLHSALLAIESLDLAPMAAMQQAGDWDGVAAIASAAGKRLAPSCSSSARWAARVTPASTMNYSTATIR